MTKSEATAIYEMTRRARAMLQDEAKDQGWTTQAWDRSHLKDADAEIKRIQDMANAELEKNLVTS